MDHRQEERIEMLQNQTPSDQSEATTRNQRYQRSLSFRNHGSRRLKKKKAIDPSSLRGSDANDTEEKALLDNLVDAIKAGDKTHPGHTRGLIMSLDSSTLLRLRFKIDLRVRKSEHPYLETGVYIPSELQTVAMEVSLLQLAVILEKEDIVQLMLDKGDPNSTLTCVHFEGDGAKYRDLDQMLHETTAFHLAARFHTNSLKLFIDHAKARELSIEDLIKGGHGRSHLHSSALHHAACNSDPESIRHVHCRPITNMRNLKK